MIDLVRQAGATLVGCGIAIEKCFQEGGNLIREQGIRVESLAAIESMSENGLVFRR
jgi:xanthine phosphoribosyltransferase